MNISRIHAIENLKSILLKISSEQSRSVILSLDIFDTILWRLVQQPTDVFTLMQNYIVRETIVAIPQRLKTDFAQARQEAEQSVRAMAQKNRVSSEIDIHDIYRYLLNIYDCGHLTDYFLKLEFDTECSVLFKNPQLDSLLLFCQSNSIKIFLLSDMYWNKSHITQMLIKSQVNVKLVHSIHVSSDYGVGKSDGKLFTRVFSDFQNTHVILHCGDNKKSDYDGAQCFGATAFLYERENEYHYYCEHTERTLVNMKPNIILNHVRKIYQLLNDDVVYNTSHQIGYYIFGPLMFEFLRQLETKQLLTYNIIIFPYREGIIMRAIYNILDLKDGSRKVLLLPFTRKSTFLGSLNLANDNIIERLLWRTSPPTWTIIAETLEMSVSFLSSVAKVELDSNMHVTGGEISVLKKIVANKTFLTHLSQNIETSRKLIQDYLEQEMGNKLCENDKILIVDVGWNGTVVKNLRNIYSLTMPNLCIDGYFMGLSDAASNTSNNGFHTFFSVSCDKAHDKDVLGLLLFKHCEILEQSLISSQNSGIGFKKNVFSIEPIWSLSDYSTTEIEYREMLSAGILDFCRVITHELAVWKSEALHSQLSYNDTYHIAERFLKFPLLLEAHVFTHFQHDDNFGLSNIRSVISDNNVIKSIDHRILWPAAEQLLLLSVSKNIQDPFFYISEYLRNTMEKNNELSIINKVIAKFKLFVRISNYMGLYRAMQLTYLWIKRKIFTKINILKK